MEELLKDLDESVAEAIRQRHKDIVAGYENRIRESQLQQAVAAAGGRNYVAIRALIGQLAAVSELPEGTKPEQLANLLEQEPAFQAALLGGNVARRLSSGELMQQVVAQKPAAEQDPPEIAVPVKKGPIMG